MAMGRPVITCDAPGCRETVEHGVNGLLVPVRDPLALTAAISRLLDNPSETQAMGQAGYDLVACKYDVRQRAASESRYHGYHGVEVGREG
jgi:glycosyltransferase involved in cell wall biosynthesis